MSTATPSLAKLIIQEIEDQEGISFPKFLEMALYHPELGYYSRPVGQVGRNGDFYTSVSIGSLYGRILARRFYQWWNDQNRPLSWRILEVGANDGQLAIDVAQEIRSLSEPAWQSLVYGILEPLPHLQNIQKQKLFPHLKKFQISENLSTFSQSRMPGIVFGNEVLDALPFHLVEYQRKSWKELFVMIGENGEFLFQPREISKSSKLFSQLEKLDGDFPDGYRTEVRTGYDDFLHQLGSCLENGTLLFADYGFARPEYYDSLRRTGTLRTFSKHQAGENPLSAPGTRDITAHVDFTDLAEAGMKCGFIPVEFSHQGSYLTKLAMDMIQSGEFSDPKIIAQFQSLTHPGHLGSKFHMIEMSQKAELSEKIYQRLALDLV